MSVTIVYRGTPLEKLHAILQIYLATVLVLFVLSTPWWFFEKEEIEQDEQVINQMLDTKLPNPYELC